MKNIFIALFLTFFFIIAAYPTNWILRQSDSTTPKPAAQSATGKIPDSTGFVNGSKFYLDLNTFDVRPDNPFWEISNKRNLPFDVPFLMQLVNIKDSVNLERVTVSLERIEKYKTLWGDTSGESLRKKYDVSTWENHIGKAPSVVLSMPPLRANKMYKLNISTFRKPTEKEIKIFADIASKKLYENLKSHYTPIIQQIASKKTGWEGDIIKSLAFNSNLKDIKSTLPISKESTLLSQREIERYDSIIKVVLKKIMVTIDSIYTHKTSKEILDKIKKDTILSKYLKSKLNSKVLNDILIGYTPNNIRNYYHDEYQSLLFDTVYLDSVRQNLIINKNKLISLRADSIIFKYTARSTTVNITIKYLNNRESAVDSLMLDLRTIASLLNTTKKQMIHTMAESATIGLNTLSTFKVRSKFYFCLDIGMAVLVAPRLAPVPYYGLNFNLAPVNREANYGIFSIGCRTTPDCSFGYRLLQSTSVVAGITVLKTKDYLNNDWSGVIGDFGVLTGIGLRLNDYLRVCGGAVWMSLKDNNPLKTDQTIVARPFVSLSLDLDMVGWVQTLVENATVNKYFKKATQSNATSTSNPVTTSK